MELGRRGFMGLLAGAVLDPERALWVPGAKSISIPAVRGQIFTGGAMQYWVRIPQGEWGATAEWGICPETSARGRTWLWTGPFPPAGSKTPFRVTFIV